MIGFDDIIFDDIMVLTLAALILILLIIMMFLIAGLLFMINQLEQETHMCDVVTTTETVSNVPQEDLHSGCSRDIIGGASGEEDNESLCSSECSYVSHDGGANVDADADGFYRKHFVVCNPGNSESQDVPSSVKSCPNSSEVRAEKTRSVTFDSLL